jgi:tetratricopeptide (TPR) repeat protein
MYVLLVAVLMAGSFYLGLRATDWFRQQSLAASPGMVDPMARGREAFDRKELQTAIVEFDAAVRLNPANSMARYWLGRALLEQGEYERAAQSFEEAVTLEPSLFDAYVQGAAAYEAMGEHSKAAAMLARYAGERKKEER